jgi:dienelactone hydrolase
MRKRKGFLSRRKFVIVGSLVGIGIVMIMINLLVSIVTAKGTQTMDFQSADGLKITADIYVVHDTKTTPFIVMFHQASWSRGEYREIAPRLNIMGYNGMAVDLRSGNSVLGVHNRTAERAEELGKQTSFVDATQDMIAAIKFARSQFHPPKLLIMGSSYSASLALKIAGDYPDLADGVIAFSPGEYFEKAGMGYTWILDSAPKITVPVFIASANMEKNRWYNIFEAVSSDEKLSYIPPEGGKHGARSLWKRYPESEEYWIMLETFLKSYF